MTPLPPNSTDRYLFKYEVSGVEHKLIIRTAPGTLASDVSDLISAVLADVGDGFWASSAVGMDFIAEGSNISIPSVYSGLVTTWGSGAAGDGGTPAFAGWAGRGLDGRKMTGHLFGFKSIGSIGDYRFTTASSAPWAEAFAEIAAAEDIFLTVGGSKAVLHPYVNIGFNSYWQRQMREN